MSKEFKAYNAKRERKFWKDYEASRNPALEDFRHRNPIWKLVCANPTYQKLQGRINAAVAKLPHGLEFHQKLNHPSALKYLLRMIRIERAYGLDKTAPWMRADTPERFREWLRRRNEILRLEHDGLGKPIYCDSLVNDAHTKAVDLAQRYDLPVPPGPPIAPASLVQAKAYLLSLRDWIRPAFRKEKRSRANGRKSRADHIKSKNLKDAKVKGNRGGRPSITGTEELRRQNILNKWKDAKEGRISQKLFCEDNDISVRYLEQCINWQTQRTSET